MNKQLSFFLPRDLMSMPSARAREPQTRPRRVLISLYFVSLELTAALGLSFALGPTLSDGGVAPPARASYTYLSPMCYYSL